MPVFVREGCGRALALLRGEVLFEKDECVEGVSIGLFTSMPVLAVDGESES